MACPYLNNERMSMAYPFVVVKVYPFITPFCWNISAWFDIFAFNISLARSAGKR